MINKSSTLMHKPTKIADRKDEHIQIVSEMDVRSGIHNGFDKYQFVHQALPEIDLQSVNPGVTLLKRTLRFPLLISSMTGGTAQGQKINRVLAHIAQNSRIAMGLGSQRIGLESPLLNETFKIRDIAPDILLFANLGAIQLNYSCTYEDCQRVVDAAEADALFLHLNPLQEALQPEGDVNFFGLLKKIEKVCKKISVPVFVKEVGWGISEEVARQLVSAGVTGIDVAGAGGTSWSEVEKYRIKDKARSKVAEGFKNWGIPTADSLVMVKKVVPNAILIASGGILNGIEAAKAIALGASLVGFASRFLKSALISERACQHIVDEITQQLIISMFISGAKSLNQLQRKKLIKTQ